jgi:hypothetical protein
MAQKSDKMRVAAISVAVTGLVAGGAYGGWQLHNWGKQRDQAALKGSGYDPMAGGAVAPELLTWREVGRIKTGMTSVRSFAILKDGAVVVAGARKLRLFSSGGTLLRDIPLQDEPHAVAATETAGGLVLFAAMKDHVEMFDDQGRSLGKWQPLGPDSVLTCLTPGGSGQTLWVADAGRRVVDEVDMSGHVIREIGRQNAETHAPGLVIPSPHLDVVVGKGPGAEGMVWVNNPGRHELEAYDDKGMMVRQWGEAGTGIGRFSGCCNPTDFFMLADGRIVTTEKGTPRVKVFDSAGVLQSVIATDFSTEISGINTPGLDVAADAQGRVWILDPAGKELRIYAPKGGA